MIRLSQYFIHFVILALAQIFIFNHIQFSNLFNAYIYILFVILLPFDVPKSFLLLSAFLLGLCIDLFSNTLGMHAAASTLAAFIRPNILQSFSPRDGYEPGTLPRIYYYGFTWFLQYALVIIFVHHFTLFFIEAFRFTNFFYTLLRVILSTIFTTSLVLISQYFIFRK